MNIESVRYISRTNKQAKSSFILQFYFAEADIPVVGNVFSFIFTKYHPDWRWRMCKVSMYLKQLL